MLPAWCIGTTAYHITAPRIKVVCTTVMWSLLWFGPQVVLHVACGFLFRDDPMWGSLLCGTILSRKLDTWAEIWSVARPQRWVEV